jgi:glycosyltransferase involved in cell wall biosynthesis
VIQVIPVALNVSSNEKFLGKKETKVLSLGFFGRLHEDRGLEIFIDIIRRINEKNTKFRVVIAGSGPKEGFLKAELRKILDENRLFFLGELDKLSMAAAWEQINVLVSTAPAESYGRTIREALFHGIGVLGIPSNGLLSLEFERSAGLVEVIEKPLNSARLLDQVLKLSTQEEIKGYQEIVLQRDSMTLSDLAESWISSITLEKLR